MRRNIEENKDLREEIRKNQEKWEERKTLERRIVCLKYKIEMMDKEKRRNNIIIKGKIEESFNDEKAVKKFFKRKLKLRRKFEK